MPHLSGRLSDAYHDFNEVECAHPDREVRVVDAIEDSVVVSRDQVRVGWRNLDERDERNVPHCVLMKVKNTDSVRMSPSGTLTVLIEIFQEAAQLFDASSGELLPLWTVEHATND
jgi:hypothetical protein